MRKTDPYFDPSHSDIKKGIKAGFFPTTKECEKQFKWENGRRAARLSQRLRKKVEKNPHRAKGKNTSKYAERLLESISEHYYRSMCR